MASDSSLSLDTVQISMTQGMNHDREIPEGKWGQFTRFIMRCANKILCMWESGDLGFILLSVKCPPPLGKVKYVLLQLCGELTFSNFLQLILGIPPRPPPFS